MSFSDSKADRITWARLGGLTTAARYDARPKMSKARIAFRESFDQLARDQAAARGEEITEAEALRRGYALYRLHFARLSAEAVKRRRLDAEAEALADKG